MAALDHPSRRVAAVLHEPLLGGATTSLLADARRERMLHRSGAEPHAEPDLRAAPGAAGRRRVERLFTLERQAEGIDAAFRAALLAAS